MRFILIRLTAVSACFCLAVAVGSSGARKYCASAKRESLKLQVGQHPVREFSRWQAMLARPLEARVEAAPDDVIDFIRLDNAYQGWSERPESKQPSPDLMGDLRVALAGIPENVRRLIEPKLVGVFLVKDLGGSAYTNWVRAADGREVAGLIALDVDVLNRRANEWATFKENSPFRPSEVWKVEARIATPENDTRAEALRYILLHEIGHVLEIGHSDFPGFDQKVRTHRQLQRSGFLRLSWALANGNLVSRFEAAFPERARLFYYAWERSQIEADQAADVYHHLGRTNFPTLYASTNYHDDFAESFASYVHTRILKRPWRVTVKDVTNDKVALIFDPCWSEARCAAKKSYIEQLLNNESSRDDSFH